MAMFFGTWPKRVGHEETRARVRRWTPASLIFRFDRWLRGLQSVFEYSQSNRCVFRAQFGCARRTYVVCGHPLRGDRIVTLHFWNEQVPVFPKGRATLGWALDMHRGIEASLHELAWYLNSYRELDDISAIRLMIPVATIEQADQLRRIIRAHGFEAVSDGPVAWYDRVRWFAENIYVSLLVFARNPGALRHDTLRRHRVEAFLLREVLERRYGAHSYRPVRREPDRQ